MKRHASLVWMVLLSGLLVASALWHPADDGGFVACLFRRATNLPCPGCGLTRSFCAMGKGEVSRALGFHALGPPLFFVATILWLRCAAAVAGFSGAVSRFDAAVRRFRLAYVVGFALVLTWVVQLILLGYTGELLALLREGPLGSR